MLLLDAMKHWVGLNVEQDEEADFWATYCLRIGFVMSSFKSSVLF